MNRITNNEAFIELLGDTKEKVINHTTPEIKIWVNSEARQGYIQAVQARQPIRNQTESQLSYRENPTSLELLRILIILDSFVQRDKGSKNF